jgi:hypothetical protein
MEPSMRDKGALEPKPAIAIIAIKIGWTFIHLS